MEKYLGCAFVFSGRSDPIWQIEEEQAQKLEAIWDELEQTAKQMPPTPQLGYRGCSMKCAPDREYIAYGRIVIKKSGNITENRIDATKHFERLLLATSPKGLLPDGLIDIKY